MSSIRRAPHEEGARWLQQAVEDLRWADDLAERGGYHIATRYPNSIPDSIPAHVFTRDAAKEAVRLAREIVTYVGDRLSRMEGEGRLETQ